MLGGCGLLERRDPQARGIDLSGDVLDRAVLAGRVHALKQSTTARVLSAESALLQRRELGVSAANIASAFLRLLTPGVRRVSTAEQVAAEAAAAIERPHSTGRYRSSSHWVTWTR